MNIIIVYLLLFLVVLSTEIPTLNIATAAVENECSICYEEFNQRLRKPITIHISHGIKHEFCEHCIIKLIDLHPIRCPTCRYILNTQEQNQLLEIRPYRNIIKISTTCLRTFFHLANFITPYSNICTYGPLMLLLSFYFGITFGLEFNSRVWNVKEKNIIISILTIINLILLALSPLQNGLLFSGENATSCVVDRFTSTMAPGIISFVVFYHSLFIIYIGA